MMINAQKLQRYIDTSAWTQETFAKQAGIGRTTLHTILKTGELKKEKYLPVFAELLGVTTTDLLPGNETNTITQRGTNNTNTASIKGDVSSLQQRIEQLERENALKDELLNAYKKLLDRGNATD
ncbi:hypothetical protein [Spirosoma sordidisoli]|uniref:Uncharacterized protein n=1 Tax=Spirosoma sordidisoli TaxID=2502893 RepID=A0A4Q2USI9_9BACT|nr:hypothetical protein [Spirosoma sordidisoli]RYC70725.1 hypothetical protein EQG79_00805 [Spirosoma sordidisoli]